MLPLDIRVWTLWQLFLQISARKCNIGIIFLQTTGLSRDMDPNVHNCFLLVYAVIVPWYLKLTKFWAIGLKSIYIATYLFLKHVTTQTLKLFFPFLSFYLFLCTKYNKINKFVTFRLCLMSKITEWFYIMSCLWVCVTFCRRDLFLFCIDPLQPRLQTKFISIFISLFQKLVYFIKYLRILFETF